MKRFQLHRDVDHTGVSGRGLVAEGVLFGDGSVVLRWLGERASTVIWKSMQDAVDVHGHDGATRFVFLD